MAQFLLEKGANIHAQDEWGNTVLSLAKRIGDQDMMLLLLNHGYNSEKTLSIMNRLFFWFKSLIM